MNQDGTRFIPYGKHKITAEDISAVIDTLGSSNLTQGPAVSAFEQGVAERVGAKHGVAVNSATSALHIACLALGLGKGDRLWTSPITFVASANCGRYCQADIDFVDIDQSTGLMCTQALEDKLRVSEKNGTLPKVLVPVHLAGSSCDMSAIASLADKYGFKVIEDASHAIGGTYKGVPVGNGRYSDITIFSFHPVKIITSGEGGLATTNNSETARRMRELRSHGIVRDFNAFKQPASGPWAYEQQSLGFNYRMTDIQAALGLSQLQRLDNVVVERNRQLKLYNSLTEELPLSLLRIPDDVTSSVHLAVARLCTASPKKHIDIFSGMREHGIGVQLHYSPVHLQPYYMAQGFGEGDFPEAEDYAKRALSLPLYPGLSDEEQRYVVTVLEKLTREE